MSQRRERLQRVLHPLIELNEFSSAQAKQACGESTPAYVTKTIKQLLSEGLLQLYVTDDEHRYRWATDRDQFESDKWIDRQINGLQVTQTPEQERPRERLLRDGPAALSSADLLAILIRVGVPNESAVAGAQKIANRFCDQLGELPKCTALQLKEITPAATKASYAQIMAGVELGRRVAQVESQQAESVTRITSTKEAIAFCAIQFARLASDAVQEEFHIVTLDTKHKPIRAHQITVGTLDASLVHPREVFRAAINDAASAILLVHNHPSGDPTPSPEDRQVTDQLTEAGKLLGISVLDHIIVAKSHTLSIREHG